MLLGPQDEPGNPAVLAPLESRSHGQVIFANADPQAVSRVSARRLDDQASDELLRVASGSRGVASPPLEPCSSIQSSLRRCEGRDARLPRRRLRAVPSSSGGRAAPEKARSRAAVTAQGKRGRSSFFAVTARRQEGPPGDARRAQFRAHRLRHLTELSRVGGGSRGRAAPAARSRWA